MTEGDEQVGGMGDRVAMLLGAVVALVDAKDLDASSAERAYLTGAAAAFRVRPQADTPWCTTGDRLLYSAGE